MIIVHRPTLLTFSSPSSPSFSLFWISWTRQHHHPPVSAFSSHPSLIRHPIASQQLLQQRPPFSSSYPFSFLFYPFSPFSPSFPIRQNPNSTKQRREGCYDRLGFIFRLDVHHAVLSCLPIKLQSRFHGVRVLRRGNSTIIKRQSLLNLFPQCFTKHRRRGIRKIVNSGSDGAFIRETS